ncbi:MAG: MaoC/PaaZ C-terminal domain-containing protein [bacterium]|nr:MaoC/PaaZ C-terminal domain-containing protein [bacterium]MDE0601998.1 MaoC/PaaZ C-terminal domain-containing protein [bacterium]
MDVSDLEGMVIGPAPLRLSQERIRSYVEATGDDPDRWVETAPPGLASAALFAVAPQLLSHPAIRAQGGAAVHGEQKFRWNAPLRAGEEWAARGEVGRVRHRRGVWFVDFALRLTGSGGEPVVEGDSSFLIAGGAPPARSGSEEPEPPPDHRADNQRAVPAGLPGEGEEIPALSKSASRADLIRYAAATTDWNPIHWDHQSAVGAGLPGVVVHGLACAAWMSQGVTRLVSGAAPLRRARFRFRRPLRPGVPAEVRGTRSQGLGFSMSLESEGRTLITATMEAAAD